MKTLFLLILSSLSLFAQGTMSVGRLEVNGYTVSGLSGFTPRTGMVVPVTDAASPTTCSSGGGSSLVWCRYNGSSWTPFSQSAGSSTGTFQTLIDDLRPTRSTVDNPNDTLSIAAGRLMGVNKSAVSCKITAGNGTGSYVVYGTDTQTIVYEYSTSAGITPSCSAGVVPLPVVTPQVPEGMIPLASGTLSSGATVSQWSNPADTREWHLGGLRNQNGLGMNTEIVGGLMISQVDPAQVQLKSQTYAPAAGVDFRAATIDYPFREATSDPTTCTGTEWWYRVDTGELKRCVSGVATVVGGGTTVAKNGVYLQIGSTNYIMPGMYAATMPTTSGMSWLANQGGASATTTGTGGALKLTLTTGTSGFRLYGKSLSGATKVTAVIGAPTWSDSGSAISVLGVGFRESGTGRIQMLRVQSNRASPSEVAASGFLSPTSFSYNMNYAPFNQSAGLLYFQGELTGGNVVFRVSTDGTNWTTVGSDTIGGFMTPDEVWVGGSAGSTDGHVLVYSLLIE